MLERYFLVYKWCQTSVISQHYEQLHLFKTIQPYVGLTTVGQHHKKPQLVNTTNRAAIQESGPSEKQTVDRIYRLEII